MHVVRLMGTSGGIRAYGTASLVTRVGAGGVEDFAHVARVLHASTQTRRSRTCAGCLDREPQTRDRLQRNRRAAPAARLVRKVVISDINLSVIDVAYDHTLLSSDVAAAKR
jgi:hypothetical protein